MTTISAESASADALARALERSNVGDFEQAIAICDEYLQANPRDAPAIFFKALVEYQRGRVAPAVALMREAVKIDSRHAGWFDTLGSVLLDAELIDGAADAFEAAAMIDRANQVYRVHLAVARRMQGRRAEAESLLRRAAEIEGEHSAMVLSALGELLLDTGREREALCINQQVMAISPPDAVHFRNVGRNITQLGRPQDAADNYRAWLAHDPGNAEALHLLAACSPDEDEPKRASDGYIETVFDHFASTFDSQLARIGYSGPQIVERLVAQHLGDAAAALDIVDAGCGTGLCAPVLKPYARQLIGVDLAARMLQKAHERRLYDALVHAEITAHLASMEAASIDLVVAADTFCYFGRLNEVLRGAARVLRPGGRLIFTVESSAPEVEQDFKLHAHGRYSHRSDYLRTVLAACALDLLEMKAEVLRFEVGAPVGAWAVVATVAIADAAATVSS